MEEEDNRERDIFGKLRGAAGGGTEGKAKIVADDEDEWGSMVRIASTPGVCGLNNPEASWEKPKVNDWAGGGDLGSRWGKGDNDHYRKRGGRGPRRGGRRGRGGFEMKTRSGGDGDRPSRPYDFERLCEYLSMTPDGVIMSLGKDMVEWEAFLGSTKLTSNKNNVIIIINLLASKVCSESILTSQQLAILSKTNAANFVDSVKNYCQLIIESVKTNAKDETNLCLLSRSGFVQLERSPLTFLKNLHQYCNYVAHHLSNKVTVDYLQPMVASAEEVLLVMKGKNNDKSIDALAMATSFEELMVDIQSLILRQVERPVRQTKKLYELTEQEKLEHHEMDTPDDYRDMTIVPTIKELLSKEEVFLRPNKTCGAYHDAHHYLDVQFRLLRQDFVEPLKLGIQDFLKYSEDYLTNVRRLPIGSIRMYPDVLIKNIALERGALAYKLQLKEGSYEKVNWASTKRLLTGSLVVLTSDLFKTAYFAVVSDHDPLEMVKGIVSVAFEGLRPQLNQSCEYLMIECEVYFEAFRHTLQILQILELEDFPMCKFIVSASSNVDAPRYLKNVEGMRVLRLKDNQNVTINALDALAWPSHIDLGLDPNQFVAFQAALTKEFAIIQGPPGTGKTYLGLRIAEAFLNNRAAHGRNKMGPILVVCYTNHALDQFLEGILELDKEISVIRVGGRCQSEILEPFTLSNLSRLHTTGLMSKDYWATRRALRSEIDELENECAEVLSTAASLKDIQGIVDFKCLNIWSTLMHEYPSALWECLSNKNWLGLTDEMFESQNFDEEVDTIIDNWFKIRQSTDGEDISNNEKSALKSQAAKRRLRWGEVNTMEDDDPESLLENRILDDVIPEFESLTLAKRSKLTYIDELSIDECDKFLNSSESMLREIRDERHNPTRTRQNLLDIQTKIRVTKHRIMLLERIFFLYKSEKIEFPIPKKFLEKCNSMTDDKINASLHKIDLRKRWALFFNVIERAHTLTSNNIPRMEARLNHEQMKLKESYMFAKGMLLQNAQVVGMTTTGAAKYRELVKMMQSKIVIVEEAAEVLESHIVTCITKHCEHLILIGDHRQLRPSTVVYELAKKFNLDVSLFERMINNNLNCYTLKVQHRMRPEIADLVVGTIYKELENHPSVSDYPVVPGVNKNLFFISHRNLEDSEMDSMSKSNNFEATYLAGLCRYFIHQGYSSDRITVLTTYTGQMFLLKKTVKAFPECADVRVTSVDSFQGEENDIILLSLVRSNENNTIGFMSIENRICVAISRARHGLFIIGNMTVLASKSQTWSQIEQKLSRRGEIGPTLTLRCQTHGTESEIRNDDDFLKKVPSGGCQLRCKTGLTCGHKCEEFCHVTDREHQDLFRCRMPCEKQCENGHPCRGLCSDLPCPPCSGLIAKKLRCSHEMVIRCYVDVQDVECTMEIVKKLPCSHKEKVPCHVNPREFRCKTIVEKELLCGHLKMMQCSEDSVLATCNETISKILTCGHEQKVRCKFGPTLFKCTIVVTRIFESCGHRIEGRCGEVNDGLQCNESCRKQLRVCGHFCQRICHASSDFGRSTCICEMGCRCPPTA